MGRRSVNTTKSGKFMNPTDQARKEARKRELKKNKKQRMAVRHAVLKSKDPLQLLEETTLYDKQEQVKLAERVKASEIPLPKLPQSQIGLITSDIPLPPGGYAKGILKKSLGAPGLPPSILPAGRKPPGPPPGTPPELSDSEEEDNFADNTTKQRKIRFADADPMPEQEELIGDSSLHLGEKFTGGFTTITPPLSQIPLPPPMALPSFTGLIRPGFPGAPQPTLSRFTYQRPTGAILSAPPSLHLRDPLDNAELVSGPAVASIPTNQPNPSGTTIEAKPQLKNLIGDATRFVPTALKVRRIVRDTSGRLVTTGGGTAAYGTGKQSNAVYDRVAKSDNTGINSGSATSKDDAYEEFMREMEGLI
ncbi:unnamed protein product [Schistosoma mattheei]|uniref:Wbp11/ELF5/Saf1 N-terminal domain-containing protein n=1 Tax=Schistosoma mattheei TaxID=31246 RepID=A0A183PUE9_9TREM|nr:unnamed protein product [Schistosoma mattheei]